MTNRTSNPLLLSLAVALTLAGCPTTVPATAVYVEVDAEPGIRASARALRIIVAGGPATAREVRVDESFDAPIAWPMHVTVTPSGGDLNRTYAISAEALDAGGGTVGTVRIISGFISRRTLFVRLLLEDCCRGTTCDDDETCRTCACATAVVDPTTPPDYVPRDAGTGADTRLDGSTRDATAECTGAADCPSARPVCDVGACVECTATDDRCTGGEVCDPDSRTCVTTCTVDADCDAGRICTAGACVEGCRVDRPCLGTASCCDDACVDVDADPRHCGGCGMACGTGESCCSGDCADTATDPTRCGACDHACGTANGTASCGAGTCSIACDATHGDCDTVNDNGCEADLRTPERCGACDAPCAVTHGAPSCVTGSCAIGSCDGGYLDCDANIANGCEAQVSIDPTHCGACGASCTAANATTACVTSACAIVTCTGGFADCDGSAATGCETGIVGNFDHCGACGRTCTLRGTLRSCSGTDCVSLGCMAGFRDCNGGADGCESYSLSDRNNCGGCGIACGAGSSCDNGGCCPLGLGYCPGVGCVNTASDRNNCGGCGRVCPGTCFDYDCI